MSKKRIPRILLIGTGRFGKIHLKTLKRLENENKIILLGAIVRNKENSDSIRKEFSINTYISFEDIDFDLRQSIDIVDIVTPPETHYDLLKKYLKFYDVIIEKPITYKVSEAKKILKLARKNKRNIFVGHIFRYDNTIKRFKKIVSNRGTPQKITCDFINPVDTDQGRVTEKELLHVFDIIDFVWNYKPKYFFNKSKKRLSVIDFKIDKDINCSVKVGWSGQDKKRLVTAYYKGEIIIADFKAKTIRKVKDDHIKEYEVIAKEEPIYIELADFVKRWSEGKKNKNALDQVKVAIEVLTTAERSVINKKRGNKVAIIGAGIFGISAAVELAERYNVDIFESREDILEEGSKINQFRHHLGYHYPRSDDTAVDIKESRKSFEDLFSDAIIDSYPTYYGLAKKGSLVSIDDFKNFCQRHNLPMVLEKPDNKILSQDELSLCIKVPEPSYDHRILKRISKKIIRKRRVNLNLKTLVTKCYFNNNGSKSLIIKKGGKLEVKSNYDYVINATYSNINKIVSWLGFENYPIRIDVAEVLIVKLPIEPISLTVIDGKYATLMPTGRKNEFTLYHVKESILDRYVPEDGLVKKGKIKSNKDRILSESKKFFPILEKAIFLESRVVRRAVRAHRENDDNRVAEIVNHGFGCYSILSGKILSSVSVAKKILGSIEND